jgi:hypothetical protein
MSDSPAVPSPNEKKENVHVKAMNEHHEKAHSHLRQAHAAAGSKAARMHITQAGMALTSLHKSAKQAMGAEGKGNGNEYDSDMNGEYTGRG